jgi:hypothetical protein
MAIRERSSNQGDFFPIEIPPERALTVQAKRKSKPGHSVSRASERATQVPDPIMLSDATPPKQVPETRVVDEKSALAVGASVEFGCWEKDRGFTLARAKVGGTHVSRRRTIIMVAVGITILGAATSSYWRPYAAAAIETGRSWLFTSPPAQVTPKARPRPRAPIRRYSCSWIERQLDLCK